jgi:hypothetical protein
MWVRVKHGLQLIYSTSWLRVYDFVLCLSIIRVHASLVQMSSTDHKPMLPHRQLSP